jgi:hypothetical protein
MQRQKNFSGPRRIGVQSQLIAKRRFKTLGGNDQHIGIEPDEIRVVQHFAAIEQRRKLRNGSDDKLLGNTARRNDIIR